MSKTDAERLESLNKYLKKQGLSFSGMLDGKMAFTKPDAVKKEAEDIDDDCVIEPAWKPPTKTVAPAPVAVAPVAVAPKPIQKKD